MVHLSTECAILRDLEQLNAWRNSVGSTEIVGLVPTMGALHAGHMTLVRHALQDCQHVVVSIFVNPLQFGPHEDFSKYPRTFEADLALCREAGVEAIYYPSVEVMYPEGQTDVTRVMPPETMTGELCGKFRPGHFIGVATVVNKLFNMVRPNRAYFGEKDYQQLQVVKRMVRDLDMQLEVIGIPTVREKDGLAMSSRNVYLNQSQRALAPKLYQVMSEVVQDVKDSRSLFEALEIGRSKIRAIDGVDLQYLEACDPVSLRLLTDATQDFVVLVAAKYGDVRLIDNLKAEL